MEFIRQMLDTMETGVWTHFEFYVIYVWAIKLPLALGAGVFFSFRPAQPTQFNTQYGVALLGALILLTVPPYYWALNQVTIWYVLGSVLLAVLFVSPPIRRRIVRFIFSWTFYASHVKMVEQTGPVGARTSIALVTIFDESPVFLDKCLDRIRRCLEIAGGEFTLIAIIDGYGIHPHAKAVVPVTKKYCDIVMTSNAQAKRSNLEAMGLEVYRRGLVKTGDEIFHLIDSDTIPADDKVASELVRPFADPRIGGVTTAQYVYQPQYFWQHVMQIFETIRTYGSQAFMSLFGSVGCLPGRWYTVLAKYITPKVFSELANDSFSWFGFAKRYCKAGDDRFVTNAILKEGGKTIIALDAVIYTITPRSFKTLRLMLARWARSSNGYTFRSLWLFRPIHWSTAFVYWTNIGLAFATCYIVFLYWPYQIIWGNKELVFIEALVFMVMSMAMTMIFRFIPVWSRQLYYLLYMPIMGFIGIFMQAIQVYGIFTHVHKIGTWGTRGADVGVKVIKPVFKVIYVRSKD